MVGIKRIAALFAISTAFLINQASAATIDFAFAFDENGGPVSGTFYGLDNSDGTSAATSVDLSTPFGDFRDIDFTTPNSLGRPVLSLNAFMFSGGNLHRVDFSCNCAAPGVGTLEFRVFFNSQVTVPSNFNVVQLFTGMPNLAIDGPFAASSDAARFTQSPSLVPLPAGGWLLVTGAAGLIAMRRQTKSPQNPKPRASGRGSRLQNGEMP